ncbi:helix-turn-helix transcriptional regulator [Oceanicoccus sp. KOV_DT_Chl]|uniref:helix-turn-helix transcriptional regulator n=1 Tax=Oceanicoccus sp. KOV_DT_Chl TaxID=1904639 RepID=UPI000C7A713A|nr:LuxR C-terminal-related transcriptional regulator [Oceanicoccus sp. KOV_DT_Chl]
MMVLDKDFSQLLGTIYQGALEEQPWQSFLALLREEMAAVNTTLVLRPPSDRGKGVLLTDGGSMEGIATYNESMFVHDPFIDLKPGEVKTLSEFISEEALLSSELYQVCMAPAGLHHSLGADLNVAGVMEARLRVARVKGAKPFADDDKTFVKTLLPHLERAISIHARLNKMESERALYAGVVEQLSVGSIILDENGRVLNANEMAARLIAAKDGLLQHKNNLQLATRDQTVELQKLIAEVLENQRRGLPAVVQAMKVQRPSGLADLGFVIRPIPTNEWSEGQAVPSVAIFVSDPEQQSEAPVQIITRLFDLTPTEAALTMLLANGLSLDEAAEQLSVSRNTARTHLRAVFSKTGVSRQPMLVRLILKSVASLA